MTAYPWFSHDLIQQRWTHPDGKDICPKRSRPSPDPEKGTEHE